MKTTLSISAVAVFSILGVVAAVAQEPEPERRGQFRDWHLYVHASDQGRTCFIVSEPTSEEGNYRRRGQPALLVAEFPMAEPNTQVSVQPGYPLKEGVDAKVNIDGQGYDFFTKDEGAWSKSAEMDAQVIDAMKRGREFAVEGTSHIDTFSRDTYSLMGFTAAFEAMKRECDG